MDLVVDTKVLAYLLLEDPARFPQCLRALRLADRILAPDLLRAELVNVLWQAVRAGRVDAERAVAMLHEIGGLVDEWVDTRALWRDALELAVARDHPAYDTLFVALALQRDLPLVTFDRRLLERFPEAAVSAEAFIERAIHRAGIDEAS